MYIRKQLAHPVVQRQSQRQRQRQSQRQRSQRAMADSKPNTMDKELVKDEVKERACRSKRLTTDNDVLMESEKSMKMTIEEKRRRYRCGKNYVTISSVLSWAKHCQQHKKAAVNTEKPLFEPSDQLNKKLSIWEGDITTLEIDAIVNAAHPSLLGGGGVDGCIHSAAGCSLKAECASLKGCQTGNAKLTSGYRLPAKCVIHTVGPRGENADKLRSCYTTCLNLCKEHKLRHVAFPCISTGLFGYPKMEAATVAITTVRNWLEKGDNAESLDRIIFTLFLPADKKIYAQLMPKYFPVSMEYL